MEQILIQNLDIRISVSAESCSNEQKLRDFIDDLIIGLGMTVIIPTLAIRVPIASTNPYRDYRDRLARLNDKGLTSITGISESHIATHSWPDNEVIYIEISSCKRFSNDPVTDIINKHFPDNSGIKYWNDEKYI